MQDEIEAIVEEHNQRVYHGKMPKENKRALRTRIKYLLKRAIPGNRAWRTLENEFFGPADYTEADHGEPPQGARW